MAAVGMGGVMRGHLGTFSPSWRNSRQTGTEMRKLPIKLVDPRRHDRGCNSALAKKKETYLVLFLFVSTEHEITLLISINWMSLLKPFLEYRNQRVIDSMIATGY